MNLSQHDYKTWNVDMTQMQNVKDADDTNPE